jgi:predicted nucleic acid-binding protein
VEQGVLTLLSSEALLLEVEKNPYPTRRAFALQVLALASATIEVTEEIETRARTYIEAGVHASDALHLASAVEANADVFSTTDDKLYRKGRGLSTGSTHVLSPLELIEELES